MAAARFALTAGLGSAGALWLQAVCTVVLVMVTWFYAKRTSKMAKATERMATENERLRKEGEEAGLRYLSQEAKMNTDLLYKHYDCVLKGGSVEGVPLVRFSVSGTKVIPKVVAYLGGVLDIMLESYLGMQRVNARIEEFYAMGIHQQRLESVLSQIPEELKRLADDGKFRVSMEKIINTLDALVNKPT